MEDIAYFWKIPRRLKSMLAGSAVTLLLCACGSGGDDGDTAGGACAYAPLNTSTQRSSLSGQLPPVGGSGSYTIVSGPSKGSVTLTNPGTGEFTYQSNTNARGTDSFTYRRGSSGMAAFKIVFMPRVMSLGDSITWGVTTDSTSGDGHNPPIEQRVGYRKSLKDGLRDAGYEIDLVGTLQAGGGSGFLGGDAQHEGHGGWTTLHLINGRPDAAPETGSGKLSEWLDTTQPDVILLHIGTNDLHGGRDPGMVAQDVNDLLDVVDNWEASHWPVAVVLARIINTNPAVGSTTTYNNALISNVYQPRATSGDRVYWVDQQGAVSAGDYADGLHPNANGYQKMGEVFMYPLSGQGRKTGSGGKILEKCS